MSRACCLALLLLAGCQDSVATPFPPGLEPFTDDAEAAELIHDGSEQLVTRAVDSDIMRAYGRGFIHAAPAVLWAAAQDPLVMIATCHTTSNVITPDNQPEYPYSFLVHYFVDDIVNVEWDDQWRGAVIAGSDDAPELVMIKHQKIQGSDFIALSEGTVQLHATEDPEITELRFVEHLDAVSGSTDDVTQQMQHNYAALRATAHGLPIPNCLR
jgi:hypothetical protein